MLYTALSSCTAPLLPAWDMGTWPLGVSCHLLCDAQLTSWQLISSSSYHPEPLSSYLPPLCLGLGAGLDVWAGQPSYLPLPLLLSR